MASNNRAQECEGPSHADSTNGNSHPLVDSSEFDFDWLMGQPMQAPDADCHYGGMAVANDVSPISVGGANTVAAAHRQVNSVVGFPALQPRSVEGGDALDGCDIVVEFETPEAFAALTDAPSEDEWFCEAGIPPLNHVSSSSDWSTSSSNYASNSCSASSPDSAGAPSSTDESAGGHSSGGSSASTDVWGRCMTPDRDGGKITHNLDRLADESREEDREDRVRLTRGEPSGVFYSGPPAGPTQQSQAAAEEEFLRQFFAVPLIQGHLDKHCRKGRKGCPGSIDSLTRRWLAIGSSTSAAARAAEQVAPHRPGRQGAAKRP